jgi:uncharacterized protein (TIGR00255 family)
LNSMTGFGRGEAEVSGLKATVEIRSVNHRFSEVMVRMVRSYFSLEDRIKEQVQKVVVRGHLDIYVNLEDQREKKRIVKLDKDLLVAYYNCLKEMAETLHIEFQTDLNQIARYPDILVVEESEEDLEAVWSAVQKALTEALGQMIRMRRNEGARLGSDFSQRKEKIAKILVEIKERVPRLGEELRSRLKSRMQVLLGDVEVDETRLLSEVVLYVERSSVTEEVVRLSSHLEQLSEILHSDGPVGRKIEFLIQEMNREINTIGSKAADLVISPLVIEVKSELEKMREQAQNLE